MSNANEMTKADKAKMLLRCPKCRTRRFQVGPNGRPNCVVQLVTSGISVVGCTDCIPEIRAYVEAGL